MPSCRSSFPCGEGSNSVAGRSPPVGLPSSEESSKSSAGPTLVLVPVFCPRRAAFTVPTLEYEWWVTLASTAAIDCCSCRHHERSRRCFRRCAAPVTGCALGSMEQCKHKKRGHAWDRRLVVVVQTNLRVHITSVMNWQGLNSEEEAEKSLKNTAKIHAIITGVSHVELEKKRPVVQVRTARSKTASRSIDWALFSIQTEWRRNASGFESAAT